MRPHSALSATCSQRLRGRIASNLPPPRKRAFHGSPLPMIPPFGPTPQTTERPRRHLGPIPPPFPITLRGRSGGYHDPRHSPAVTRWGRTLTGVHKRTSLGDNSPDRGRASAHDEGPCTGSKVYCTTGERREGVSCTRKRGKGEGARGSEDLQEGDRRGWTPPVPLRGVEAPIPVSAPSRCVPPPPEQTQQNTLDRDQRPGALLCTAPLGAHAHGGARAQRRRRG